MEFGRCYSAGDEVGLIASRQGYECIGIFYARIAEVLKVCAASLEAQAVHLGHGVVYILCVLIDDDDVLILLDEVASQPYASASGTKNCYFHRYSMIQKGIVNQLRRVYELHIDIAPS